MKENTQFDISVWAVVKIILVLAAFYLLFLIRDILALFFVVLILVAAFNPVINSWEKKIGRGPAVLLLFLAVLSAISAVFYLIVPPLVDQILQLVDQLPGSLNQFNDIRRYIPNFERALANLAQNLANITGGFVSITASVFGGVFTFLSAIVLTAYLLLDKDAFANFIASILPEEAKDSFFKLIAKIGQKLGNWFRGQLLLGTIIAILDGIGLVIIGIPFSLTLAVISGILEIVPTIGPIVAGTIAVAIALLNDPVKAIFVAALYILVQQLENNFIVPKVMQKAVGLSPVIIIFSILIGAKLLGIAGAILAVPLAGTISVIVKDWPSIRKAVYRS